MKFRIKLNADSISAEDFLFLWYFCSTVINLMFSTVFGKSIGGIFYISIYIFLLVICLSHNVLSFYFYPILVYFLVFLLFILTILIHPEYNSWFSHDTYGIVPALLHPKSGIWAFLIIWLMKDEKKIVRDLKVACILLFVFHLFRFIVATIRGYWNIYDFSGQIEQGSYNLEFGYDMLFPTAFMGAYAFIYNKRVYYIPYFIGLFCIIMGGSRGAIIWPIVLIPMMLPFRWREKKNYRAAVIILLALILVTLNYKTITVGILSILKSVGLESRTIESILNGTFSDGSGREAIYSKAIEMIKDGGFFGWGVYGDRYEIGRIVKWGYSHNVFLELLISFGFFFGSIICIWLVKNVIGLYRKCMNNERKIILMTFLITSFKIIFSNSFWYTGAFWGVLALILKWSNDRLKKSEIQSII